jgi:rhodanese-related sulfurtransferase
LKKFYKFIAASFIAAFAVTGLTGCSAEEPMDMSTYAAVIDVRTPEETSAGHLEGAKLFDIQDAAFMDNLATLDKSANYYVYCRSGNRSGQAIEIMKQEGFTGTLHNGGSLANAASETGLAVVQ